MTPGAARRGLSARRERARHFRALRHPLFPLTFFRRNLATLAHEGALPSRRALARLLSERCRAFLAVGPRSRGVPGQAGKDADGYCDHCGGCCEVASGLPEFPEGCALPMALRDLFGAGLGRGHRFCPFLWEARAQKRSLCAIHAHRPLPCRAFEEEECEALRADPDFRRSLAAPLPPLRVLLRLLDG